MNKQTREHLDQMFDAANKHSDEGLYRERIEFCRGMIAALQIEGIIKQDEAEMFYTRFKTNELRRSVELVRSVRMNQK